MPSYTISTLYLRYIYTISTQYLRYPMFCMAAGCCVMSLQRCGHHQLSAECCSGQGRVQHAAGRRCRCHLLPYFQVIIIGQRRQIMAEKGQNFNTAAPCAVCGHTAVAGWCRGVQVLQPSLASSTPVALQGVHQHRPHSAALRSAARSQHQSAAVRSTAVH